MLRARIDAMSRFYPLVVVVVVLMFVDYQWPNTVELVGNQGSQLSLGDQILDTVNDIVEPMDFTR